MFDERVDQVKSLIWRQHDVSNSVLVRRFEVWEMDHNFVGLGVVHHNKEGCADMGHRHTPFRW